MMYTSANMDCIQGVCGNLENLCSRERISGQGTTSKRLRGYFLQ